MRPRNCSDKSHRLEKWLECSDSVERCCLAPRARVANPNSVTSGTVRWLIPGQKLDQPARTGQLIRSKVSAENLISNQSAVGRLRNRNYLLSPFHGSLPRSFRPRSREASQPQWLVHRLVESPAKSNSRSKCGRNYLHQCPKVQMLLTWLVRSAQWTDNFFWADLWRIDCAMNVTICVTVGSVDPGNP